MKPTYFLRLTAIMSFALLAACDGDDGAQGATGPAGPAGPAGPTGASGTPNSVTRADVVRTNANIAFANYGDSYLVALDLRDAILEFTANPTAETHQAAKDAWLASNEPYGQTEVYRFRVGPIDALLPNGQLGVEGDGPEGKLNAWPLAEALIDYVANTVDGDEGPEIPTSQDTVTGNIISDLSITIDEATIRGNNELGGDERNVTTGYHVVEFLLWGQDLNLDGSGTGTRDATGGQRPFTDYVTGGGCTSGTGNGSADIICERRADYLELAVDLLIDDLNSLVEAWNPNGTDNHYCRFTASDPSCIEMGMTEAQVIDRSLAIILEGMGRLGFGELAGERMNIALLTNSQEDEHSCFSDNTHRDIFTNAKGIVNMYTGDYTRIDGEVVSGAGIDDLLLAEGFAAEENALRAALEDTMIKVGAIDTVAKGGTPFDNQIQLGINEPNISGAIRALSTQTDFIEDVIGVLGLTTGDLRQDTEEDI
ncbi:MAG: imelysin family protein [Pseudomonadota bacterium]